MESQFVYRTGKHRGQHNKGVCAEEYRTVWGNIEGGKPRGGWDQAAATGDEQPKPNIPADHKYYSLFDDRVQEHSMKGHSGVVLKY